MSPVIFKMSFAEKVTKFCKSNVVALTLVPLIVGVHWGWYKLQDIPYLVRPENKKELPIVLGAKELWAFVAGEANVDEKKSSR